MGTVAYGWSSTFLATVPYLALTTLGVVLLKRKSTVAAALVALGFAGVMASRLASGLISYKYSYIYNAQGSIAAAQLHFEGWIWHTAYWGSIVGMWVGTAGLLWHTLVSANASPNNRWRAP